MTSRMKSDKGSMVTSILALLEVPEEKKSNLSENLNKMSKAALGLLDFYIMEKIDPNFKEDAPPEAEAPERVAIAPPLKLMPTDIRMPRTARDTEIHLQYLPFIGERLLAGWRSGDFVVLKRNLRICERITDGCRKMIASQLYDAIKDEVEE